MTGLYVRFKGGSWIKSCYEGDFKEYINTCYLTDNRCKYLMVKEGENWKYQWMEEDDRRKDG